MRATVVVTCYNHAAYLPACLDSILAQHIDFICDIVVADDCSTDHSQAIIQAYQQQYPQRIISIFREKNLGHQQHYLATHREVTGDIIFEFDGDDVMLPGKLQQQYDVFLSDPAIHVIFHRAEYFSDDACYTAQTGAPLARLSSQHSPTPTQVVYFDCHDLALWGTVAAHGSYAYRRTARTLWEVPDAHMEWLFAMNELMPTGKGAYLNAVLMRYRCNPAGHGSYLSSYAGRTQAYRIYLLNVLQLFEGYPTLRTQLYANALISACGMWWAGCGYVSEVLAFLWKKRRYIRIALCYKAARMRIAVAPARRVR